MNRRAFLTVGLGAGGAFVVGCALAPTGGRIWQHQRRTGDFEPNAWLEITPDDRIIFVLDRVEMGQGTTTSHAALVAEELEVAPGKLEIEAAEADRAYDNPDPQLGMQVTGGSTSTKTSWHPLRHAGAVAREMLRAGAAARWRVPIAECVARDGAIHHDRSKRSATYGDLVADAAAQPVPHVELKDPKQFRIVGTPIDRLDARPKVDGSGIYGIDVQLPGLVTAVIVRPPVRGATLKHLDASKAKAGRGVRDVVTLAEGVAVVADGYWEARRAAGELAIEWDEGHNATLDSAALVASYEKLTERAGDRVIRKDGDAYAALGAKSIEAIYALPYLAHATMEPMNATAVVTGDRCEVWAPTQAPGIARWRVAEAIGFDLDAVAIHTTLVGGGFGRRLFVDYAVEAAKLAQRIGKPVKVVWSREDDLANDFYRPMAVSRLRGAVDAKGAIVAWLHRLVTDPILGTEGGDFAGALVPNAAPRAVRRLFADSGPRLYVRGPLVDANSGEGAGDLPYAIPNLRVELTHAEPGVPVGFWRAVGHSHTAFVTEGFLDELIHAAGKDPYQARRELLANHPRHRAVLDLAAQKAGWTTPPPAGVGRGIAVHASFDSYCAQVIEASVDGDRVRVHRVVVAIDCGRVVNPQLVAAQAESAVIFGLSAALAQQITFSRGRVEQTNYDTYPLLRMHECPAIETHLVPSTEEPTGVGEPGLPPVAPALCGAIFAATGRRIRRLPVTTSLPSTDRPRR